MAHQGNNKKGGLLEGDRLKKELEAQKARAMARLYVQEKGCMNVSVTERVLQQGTFTGAEASELAVSMGGGISVYKDNTLEVLRQREQKKGAGSGKESELKARLVKQQEDFRREQEGKATGGKEAAAKEEAPLPTGWQEVKDPSSKDVYYWNTTTGETSWDRPKAPAQEEEAEKDGGAAASSSSSTAQEGEASASAAATAHASTGEGGLPPGWKEIKHAATGQTLYLHEATGTKRWERPTGDAPEEVTSDIAQRQREHAAQAQQQAAAARAQQQQQEAMLGKRGRPAGHDPLDPTGGRGGAWNQGRQHERMADSTAGGALWQQRPLPAPGQILKHQRR